MSEYQYYEFQAVDRALSNEDRTELRRISSRAQITATSFTNHYEWGDLKADPTDMMKRWFDLHLYLANWGSRRFMIRLPKKFIDRDRFKDFLPGIDKVAIYDSVDNTIFDVDIPSEYAMPEDSYDWDDGSGWLAALAPLRGDLLSGDLRVLYLAWLIGVQWEIVPGNEMEPLPGIGPMNGGLEAFADFFQIDSDLVSAASESGAVSETPELSAETLRAALDTMEDEEKTSWLYRLVQGDPREAAEAELRKARRLESERRKEEERRDRLRDLRLRGEDVWQDIENEINMRNVSAYDRAAALISDLRAIAEEDGASDAFSIRLNSLLSRHSRKGRFLERLDSF